MKGIILTTPYPEWNGLDHSDMRPVTHFPETVELR